MTLNVSRPCENLQEGKVCDDENVFIGENTLHTPSDSFPKEHSVQVIEILEANKKNNLKDNESINAYHHRK